MPYTALRHAPLDTNYRSKILKLPEYVEGHSLAKFSKVIGSKPECRTLSFRTYNQSDTHEVQWPTKRPPVDSPEDPGQSLLFREGFGRVRPTMRSQHNSGYKSLLGPVLLGGGSLMLLILLFLRWRQRYGYGHWFQLRGGLVNNGGGGGGNQAMPALI